MKRISRKTKRRSIRLRDRRTIVRTRRAKRRRQKRKSVEDTLVLRAYRRKRARREASKVGAKIINCPAVLSTASEHSADLVAFLVEIKRVLESRSIALIDFGGLRIAQATGMIVVLAHLDVFDASHPGCVRAKAPQSNLIRQVFCHLNLNHRFGMSFEENVCHETVVDWICCSGLTFDESGPTLCRKLKEICSAGDFSENAFLSLCVGVKEAIVNAQHHAYSDEHDPELKKWWAFIQIKEGYFSVVVYDVGVGIPATLSKTKRKGLRARIHELRSAYGHINIDHLLLESAIKTRESETGKDNRGYGMLEIHSVIETVDGSELLVYSRRGVYESKTGTAGRSRRYPKKRSLPGTLVSWRAPITRAS